MQRADCKNGVLLINKVSADEDEFVTLYVVSDRMGEGDCPSNISKKVATPRLVTLASRICFA